MKTIVGKEYRKEGKDGERLYTVIQCCDCGAKTYERKKDKIDKALNADCRSCQHKAKSETRLQSSFLRDGRTKHPLYWLWCGMIQRCYDHTHKDYQHYGGRGIEVCFRWLIDFWAFVEDVGERPDGTTLDRIDNDDIYSPLNCKWSTPSEQLSNRRAWKRSS
jgi:hypothetical protein